MGAGAQRWWVVLGARFEAEEGAYHDAWRRKHAADRYFAFMGMFSNQPTFSEAGWPSGYSEAPGFRERLRDILK